MKKIIYLFLSIGIIAAGIFFWLKDLDLPDNIPELSTFPVSNSEIVPPQKGISGEKSENSPEKKVEDESEVTQDIFILPLDKATERVTKKPFGIFITPEISPVQPERFSGYHTGVDFEIFPEELEKEVVVKTVCSGKLLVKRLATGYGGVIVQSCELEGGSITVVYGHLKLDSIKIAIGEDIAAGEVLGALGRAHSSETGGERKHLHLGFYKGSEINILGYVSSKNLLSNWLDPMLFLK